MFRLMLALTLLCVLSGRSNGEFPFDSLLHRTHAKPWTDLGRYHGLGYGPGYHHFSPTPHLKTGAFRGVRREIMRGPRIAPAHHP